MFADICVIGWSKTSVVYFATGDSATLICPLNTFGEHVTWRKDRIIINDAENKINPILLNNEKYRVVSNETHRNVLYIRMAEDDEVGEYHCVTTINNAIKTGFVQLLKKGKDIFFQTISAFRLKFCLNFSNLTNSQ